jgi:hypothetical protein
MKNWVALGERDKAEQSRNWLIGTLAYLVGVIVLSPFLPESRGVDAVFRFASLALLIAWIQLESRPQQDHVKARFGTDYPRRGWGQPILLAVAAVVGLVMLVFALAYGIAVLR